MRTRREFLKAGAWCLAVALACFAPSCRSHASSDPKSVHIVVLHTNDIHGQVLPRTAAARANEPATPIGGLSRLAARIQEVRASEPNVIVVDTGDWTQGTPEGALDDGLGVLQALAAIGYDALCIGNHDFDRGVAQLREHLGVARLPALLANVREKQNGERVPWAQPWRIVRAGGVRIALVGLLTTATPEITHVDAQALVFEDPSVALVEARRELAGTYDLLIPLAHLGLDEARKLARENPDLPLIVSGHSHDRLPSGEHEGETLIVQTGSRAAALGRVDLWLEDGRVQRATASLEDLLNDPPPAARVAAVDRICDSLAERASQALARVVGVLSAPAQRHKELGSSSAGNWICDAMREHTSADVALHNKGGTRSDLSAGPVTQRDLYEFLPFDNELVVLELTGAELESCMRRAFETPAHKGLDFSGMRAFVRRDQDDAVRLVSLEFEGKSLERDKQYRVVTSTFLAEGGDGLIELQQARRVAHEPLLQRDLMLSVLSLAPCAPSTAQRVVLVDEAAQIPLEASAKK